MHSGQSEVNGEILLSTSDAAVGLYQTFTQHCFQETILAPQDPILTWAPLDSWISGCNCVSVCETSSECVIGVYLNQHVSPFNMFWRKVYIIGPKKYIFQNKTFLLKQRPAEMNIENSEFKKSLPKILSGSFFLSFRGSWLDEVTQQDWCKRDKYISTFKDLIHLHQRDKIILVTGETWTESRQAFGWTDSPNGGVKIRTCYSSRAEFWHL